MLFLQLLINGIVTGCGYALVAIGFGLIYSTTRIFHFAHGVVYTSAAYLFYTLLVKLQWHYMLAAVVTVMTAALAGVLIDKLLYRGLIKPRASLLILMLSSLGLYTIIVNAIALGYGSGTLVIYNADFTLVRSPLVLTALQFLTFIMFLLLTGALTILLRKTQLGRLVRATRDNPEMVSAMGFNLHRVRWVAFSLGSGFAAVAAILGSLDHGLNPHIGMNALLNAAIAVILGGIDHFRGAVVGALVLGILQSIVIWGFSAKWIDAVAFVTLVCFLMYRPEGVFTRERRVEEMAA